MRPFPSMLLASTALGGGVGGSGQAILTTTGAGTWTVPVGFNSANNTVELIGAGGSGALGTPATPGKGGGGGQYAKLTNFSAVAGTNINYQIGLGGGPQGTSASPGTADTWFDSSTTTAYAQGGATSPSGTGAGSVGGSAAAVGSCIVRNGGNSGSTSGLYGGSGGGGAGGPTGAGSSGGNDTANGAPGGNGGAANNNGVSGGGGVAGAAGNAGGTQNVWGVGKGPGSGGGGGSGSGNHIGGNGGNYGGGGGGSSWDDSTTHSTGGQGIIVITWGANVATDPYVANNPLLTGAEGTNGSTTVLDESFYARTMTAVGGAVLDTSQFKFGSSSLHLPSSGDGVTTPTTAQLSFLGDFTVEIFARFSTVPTVGGDNRYLIGSTGNDGWDLYISPAGGLNSAIFSPAVLSGTGVSGNVLTTSIGGGGWATNQWYHLCMERTGTKLRVYLDGVMTGTCTCTGTVSSPAVALALGTLRTVGWLDEARVSQVSRYGSDAGFTVPTAAFPRS